MELIKVDYDKCIKCGICVDICPSCILEMGEAGPEAIMPLKRGADGSLGVQSEGGGGTHITMNINAVDSRSFVEMMRSNRASVESIVVENIMKNGALRSAIRGMA